MRQRRTAAKTRAAKTTAAKTTVRAVAAKAITMTVRLRSAMRFTTC